MLKYDNRTIVYLDKCFMTAKKKEKAPSQQKSQGDLTHKIRSLMEQIKHQAKLQETQQTKPRTFKHEK